MLMGVGGFSVEMGVIVIENNEFDLFVIGCLFIVNLDYIVCV